MNDSAETRQLIERFCSERQLTLLHLDDAGAALCANQKILLHLMEERSSSWLEIVASPARPLWWFWVHQVYEFLSLPKQPYSGLQADLEFLSKHWDAVTEALSEQFPALYMRGTNLAPPKHPSPAPPEDKVD